VANNWPVRPKNVNSRAMLPPVNCRTANSFTSKLGCSADRCTSTNHVSSSTPSTSGTSTPTPSQSAR
jgi:hypothetical protein